MHIAIITRASKDREDTRISVKTQDERCRRLAADKWPELPIETYEDNDESGADPAAKRERFNAFLAALRAGDVAHVVAHEQSRITRIPEVWEQLTVALSLADIKEIHTVQQGIISVGSGNRLVGRLLAIVDAEEVERTRARVLAAHQQLATEGRPQGGRCYGFDYAKDEDKRSVRVINPAEAEVVREIADRLINGHSATSIAADLNARDVSSPRGKGRWHLSSVKYVISKPAVAGLRSHHGKLTDGRWDAIVPEARWRKAVRALGADVVNGRDGKQHRVRRVHQSNTRRWLLTGGIAACAQCQMPLAVAHTNGRACYTCRKDMGDKACAKVSISPAADVEAWVVREIMLTVERSPRLLKAVNGQPDPKRGKLHDELTAAEDALREQARRFGLGEITDVEWEAMAGPLRARAAKARDGLAALPELDIDLPPFDQIAALWDDMPLRQRRAFIEQVVRRVEISPALRKGYAKRGEEDKRIRERVHIIWRA
jgi:DNA invertase Pin-like site-specific DNA recombinase